MEIFPPITLGEKSHISLVDIKIPEEVTKSFTFTGRQAIYSEPSKGDLPKLMGFPKGVYNIYKLRYEINNNRLTENIGLNIETINNNVYIETKSNTIKVSRKLAQILNNPETLPPFSSVKISGDEKYLINCNLVENRSSYSFGATVYPSNLLEIIPLRDERYPELKNSIC